MLSKEKLQMLSFRKVELQNIWNVLEIITWLMMKQLLKQSLIDFQLINLSIDHLSSRLDYIKRNLTW